MTQTDSPITVVTAGPAALTALAQAVSQAQADDRLARVVIIADHHDAARSVRHLLGARGMINVTVQVGRHLAHELARPIQKPLTRLLESQAVHRVAEGQATELGLEPAGRRRFYGSLVAAFREMQEREQSPDCDEGTDGMNRLAESLYADYRAMIADAGYYAPAELPQMAADALVDNWPDGSEPAVIYYFAPATVRRRCPVGKNPAGPGQMPGHRRMHRRRGRRPPHTRTAGEAGEPLGCRNGRLRTA